MRPSFVPSRARLSSAGWRLGSMVAYSSRCIRVMLFSHVFASPKQYTDDTHVMTCRNQIQILALIRILVPYFTRIYKGVGLELNNHVLASAIL